MGIKAQLAALEERHGTPDATFTDEGFSGGNPKRPGLIAMMEGVRGGDTVHVAKRCRLARDSFLSAWIEKEVQKRGGSIQSLDGGNGSEATDILLRQIVCAFAEFERNLAGQRTRAALGELRKTNRKTGGTVPYGFDADGAGTLHPVDNEMATVDGMQKMRAAGASLAKIAEALNGAGTPAKGGGKWHPKTVRGVLLFHEGKAAA